MDRFSSGTKATLCLNNNRPDQTGSRRASQQLSVVTEFADQPRATKGAMVTSSRAGADYRARSKYRSVSHDVTGSMYRANT